MSCKEPKCVFSNRFSKCIKPNPYIEMIAKCGREKIKRKDCKYHENKEKAVKDSCKNYNVRTKKIVKIKSLSSETKRKLDNIKKNIMARKITKNFKRFILPFVNRVSANIKSRIEYYNKLDNILNKINDKQCINYINDGKSVKRYNIGNNDLILEKKIGSNSVYGIIYFSKIKLYKFASKIMHVTPNNKNEVKITKLLSNITIGNKNPHFPIIYKTFECNTPPINDSNFPPLINNKKYYVILNELANGDLKTFLPLHYNNEEIIQNTIQQIFISILAFHRFANLNHDDCHWGNFLYHKIKPGGYIHYKIFGSDIYIKNVGFLWIIWDYGLTKSLSYNNLRDYNRIIQAFKNTNNGGWVKTKEFIYNDKIKDIVKNYDNNVLYNYQDDENLWINKILNNYSKIKPANSDIINLNNPYIIS